MFHQIYQAMEKPSLYAKTDAAFWDDEYISSQMLKAHLDPEFEGASRRLDFIEKSVAWITQTVSPSQYPSLIDIGCGPGLYAERFAKEGYQVTGIDFSRRSIDYAKRSAAKEGLAIDYYFQDYLELDVTKTYDFATMIYCDYGALSTTDRKTLLRNLYRSLRPGGKLLLDVFSTVSYHKFQEKQTWEICQQNGFWREDGYLALIGRYRYPPNVTLEQVAIVSEHQMKTYYLWNTYFSKETVSEEVGQAGFQVCKVFGDVAGSPYHKNALTLAVLFEK